MEAPFFIIEAATFDQVERDDLIVADPVMGWERVTGVTVHVVPSPAVPTLVVLRLEYRRFAEEDYADSPERFIVRGVNEPLPRLLRVAREAARDVQRITEDAAALSCGLAG